MGGAQYQAKQLVERLVERGEYDVHYVTRVASDGLRPTGYTIHRIGHGRRVAGTYLQDSIELWRVLRSVRPDVIYQRVGCSYTGVAAHYARIHGARMVWHVALDSDVAIRRFDVSLRMPLQWLEQRVLAYGVRHADAIVVQHLQQAAMLQRNYGREFAAHIPNFHPLPAEHLSKMTAPIAVCWVANIKPSKRPSLFLRLARELAYMQNVDWVMAGQMQIEGEALAQFERELNQTGNVKYLGPLPQDDVNHLLGRSHVFVNTSVEEGFANTFIQCWLRKVLVVSLAVNPDGMFDGDRYGLTAGDDFEQLKTQTLRAINDAGLRESVGTAALELARERFSERNIDQLIDLLAPPSAKVRD